jgi:hypothetical protein
MTIAELKKLLKRGAKVKVRNTFDNDELHGLTVFVKSKKPAECKKRPGQCSEDRKCVGLSVFVCKEDPTIETEGPKGAFRAGAYKICLSHLTTEDDVSLLAEKKVKGAVTPKPEPIAMESVAVVETVTWEALAHVAQAAQAGAKKSGLGAVTELIKLSRSLMSVTEQMKTKLISAQDRLLRVQEAAIHELMGPEEMAPAEIDDKKEEEKPVMGFSPPAKKEVEGV